MEKVSPSRFFSSPVTVLNKPSGGDSPIATAESDSSSYSGGTSFGSDGAVVNVAKRKCIETSATIATKKKRDADGVGESTSGKEAPITRPIRQYFCPRTNQPFASATELQDHSGCEDVENWLHEMNESLINDFDDISDKEKKFMNLWNRFIKCHHVIADRDIPRKVETFILMNRDKLKGADLRMNLLLHLNNLWDFGLISSNRISAFMAIYDD